MNLQQLKQAKNSLQQAIRLIDKEIEKSTDVKWEKRSISELDSDHLLNISKMLHGWASDRHARGGYDSMLNTGFTIRETVYAINKEMWKRAK